MVRIVTQIRLKEGSQHEWDAAMRERMAAAVKHPGWIGGQLLQGDTAGDRRINVGTLKSRADWQAWHQDPKFTKTRAALEGLAAEPEQHTWCRVVVDARGK